MRETTTKVAVIGFGGTHHHDDGVGAAVARRLREQTPAEVAILEQTGDYDQMSDAIAGFDLVILVDSSCTGAEPGTIYRLEGSERPGYGDWFPYYAAHSAGLTSSYQLNQMLGTMPTRLLLFCVEGGDFSEGDELSPRVEASVDKVVAMLLEEVQAATA